MNAHPALGATPIEELVGNLPLGVPTRVSLEVTPQKVSFARACVPRAIELKMVSGTTFTKASFTLRPRSGSTGPGSWRVVLDDAVCEAH